MRRRITISATLLALTLLLAIANIGSAPARHRVERPRPAEPWRPPAPVTPSS
jgi:hypothetical protein